jgi:hypothetical protein
MCGSKLGRLNRYEEGTPTLTPMFYRLFYPLSMLLVMV